MPYCTGECKNVYCTVVSLICVTYVNTFYKLHTLAATSKTVLYAIYEW